MRVVYKAEDLKLNRSVALKFLRSEATENTDAKARFLREAQAAAALDHENVCTVYEIDEADGQTFLSMAYLEGETVREKTKTRPLKIEEALDIAIQTSLGLQAAHEKEIVHRDIKSANLIVTPRGQVKIMDFGLAQLAEQSRLTKTAMILGTPAYMSPEQVRREPTDRRTDIWSLGVVIYEMVTGRLPFAGERQEAVLYAISNQDPEPVTALRAGLPMELEFIVGKALAKDPANRYQHVDEMIVDLRAIEKKSVGEESPSRLISQRRRAGTRSVRFAYFGAAALAVLLILGLWFWGRGWRSDSRQAGTQDEQVSIVVIPLDNLSGDPNQEYFSDGMTDALIANLAMIRDLRVISRTSAMQYKGARKSAKQISEELGVRYLVEGSVLREGDRVRIVTQLVDAVDDRSLWSETWERNARDVLKLQGETAHAIARQIRIKLTAREQESLTGARPVEPAVYETYLKGMHHIDSWTPAELQRSVEYFEEVIGKDSEFAPAYVGLASAYRRVALLGDSDSREMFSKSRQLSMRALELDEESGEAHWSLAIDYSYDWDWADCEQEFVRALELSPSNALVHHAYGNLCLAPQGGLDEALGEMHQAVELDPLSPFHHAILGKNYAFRGEHDRAVQHLRKALTMVPNFVMAQLYLGELLARRGDYEEGLRLLEAAAARGTPRDLGYLGHGYGLAGRREDALGVLRKLETTMGRAHPPSEAIARVYIGLGNKQKALEVLERAYEDRDPRILWLKVDPVYDPLRDEPRFQVLLVKMNLSE